MANSTAPLTDTQIRRRRPQAREHNLSDGGGLQLRIKPSGSKVWLFNYPRPGTKRRTNLKLGTYPALTLADARKKRDECRALLEKSIDPQEYRAEQSRELAEAGENTLKYVGDKWFEMWKDKKNYTEDYADDLYSSLDNHVFKKIGNRPIHKITAIEVFDVLKPLQEAGKLETLRRVCQRLNLIMNYAVRKELVAVNKLISIGEDFQAPAKRNYPTIKPSKLPQLMEDLSKANIKPVTRYLFEWQLHTMVRPGEAAGTRWEEIDLDDGVWAIPEERMKKRRAHVVPLTLQTLKILKDIEPFSGHREHVFPGDRKPRQHANKATVNMALRRIGYEGILVAHGLRALASTTLNEHDFNGAWVESALAHFKKDKTEGKYNRAEYLKQRRVMMQWWSEHIQNASISSSSVEGKKSFKIASKVGGAHG